MVLLECDWLNMVEHYGHGFDFNFGEVIKYFKYILTTWFWYDEIRKKN